MCAPSRERTCDALARAMIQDLTTSSLQPLHKKVGHCHAGEINVNKRSDTAKLQTDG